MTQEPYKKFKKVSDCCHAGIYVMGYAFSKKGYINHCCECGEPCQAVNDEGIEKSVMHAPEWHCLEGCEECGIEARCHKEKCHHEDCLRDGPRGSCDKSIGTYHPEPPPLPPICECGSIRYDVNGNCKNCGKNFFPKIEEKNAINRCQKCHWNPCMCKQKEPKIEEPKQLSEEAEEILMHWREDSERLAKIMKLKKVDKILFLQHVYGLMRVKNLEAAEMVRLERENLSKKLTRAFDVFLCCTGRCEHKGKGAEPDLWLDAKKQIIRDFNNPEFPEPPKA